MKRGRKSLNRSIMIGCVIFMVIIGALLSFVNIYLYRKYVYDDYRDYTADILEYADSRIDGDDLKACIETGEESAEYRDMLLFMDNIIDNFDDIHYLYAVLPLNTNETENVMSVFSAERYYDRYVDTEGNLYLGWISDDEFDRETVESFFDIMKGDGIEYFVEETEWGVDFTGAMPIKDSAGNAVAVLAADIDFSFMNGMIREYALMNILVVAIAGAVFITLFVLWSRSNITIPISKLEKSAVGFIGHSHGARDVDALAFEVPDIRSDNEIRSLSDAIVKMTEDMRDYVTDILSAEEKAASMQELAIKDSLTGIRNKTAYDNEVQRLEEGLKEGDKKLGIAMVDLNFLKRTNDTYGHDKGNISIKKLSKLVCDVFSHSPVFRIGGDEFVIILRGTAYDDYDKLEKTFNDELLKLKEDDSLEPWERVSAAIGAAFYDDTVDGSVEDLFKRADSVMYEKKKEMKAARES